MTSFVASAPLPVATDPANANAVGTNALVANPTPFDPLPTLKPLKPSSTALVPVEQTGKKWFWQSWFEATPKAPEIDDPGQVDANRAWAKAGELSKAIQTLHGQMGNNAALLSLAPNTWRELLTPYIVARASAVAMLASTQTSLDAAVEGASTATIDFPSRTLFQSTVNKIRAADAECLSLMPTAEKRHQEALALVVRAQKEKDEAAEAVKRTRESIKELSPERRQSLVKRIAQLHAGGYGFAAFALNAPENPQGADCMTLAPEGVIPTLVLKGGLVFGKINPRYTAVLPTEANPIGSLEELVDMVDSLMGRDKTVE